MGTYRHLMIYFCCFSIFFSIIDVIVQPTLFTYRSGYFMIIDVRRRGMSPEVAVFFMKMLCGCFGVTIYGIAIHFVYRFFALERKGKLKYFEINYLALWFMIPVVGGFSWYITIEIFFESSPHSLETEYLRNMFNKSNLNFTDFASIGGVYYQTDMSVNWRSISGYSCFVSIMVIAFIIIVVAGWKSWKIVSKLLEHGESDFSRKLQMQLYKALVAQTIIPVTLLFIPFGVLFTIPLFNIDWQVLNRIIVLIFAFYPVIDPLPIIYFVDYYRIPVLDAFKCKINQIDARRSYSENTVQN
ncbi:unnamed protein product [Caenorhabditis nigoni]